MADDSSRQSLDDQLTSLLARQAPLLDEIETLTADCAECIEQGQDDRLRDLTGRRGDLLERAHRIALQVAPLRVETIAENTRATLERIDEQIAGLLRADRLLRERVTQRRAEVAGRIGGIGRGRAAVGAYGPAPRAARPRYQDRSA